jgi:hypothetical protein
MAYDAALLFTIGFFYFAMSEDAATLDPKCKLLLVRNPLVGLWCRSGSPIARRTVGHTISI